MDFVGAPELRIRRGLRTLPLAFHFAKTWNPDEYGIQPDDVLCVCRAMLSEICFQLFDQNKFSKARTESFRSVKAWDSRIPFESYALKSLQFSIADSVLYRAEDNELNDAARDGLVRSLCVTYSRWRRQWWVRLRCQRWPGAPKALGDNPECQRARTGTRRSGPACRSRFPRGR